MKKLLIFVLIVSFLVACKTIPVKNQETTAKILFKNLLKESEKVSDVYATGLMRISGVKEIPAGYLKFESYCNAKTTNFTFKISFLNKPIIEIILENNKVLFINHTGKQYIRLSLDQLDFSKFIGINFNPFEISYLFIGKIPYSENMNLMDYKFTDKEFNINITNNVSKYSIYLNSKEEIKKVIINDQYFGTLIMDPVTYTKNDDGINVPKNLNFSTEDSKINMSFIIDKISLKQGKVNSFDISKLNDYTEVFDVNEIKVKLK